MENNLKNSNKNKAWLDKELEKQGYNGYENILLATITNDSLNIFDKDTKTPKKVLE